MAGVLETIGNIVGKLGGGITIINNPTGSSTTVNNPPGSSQNSMPKVEDQRAVHKKRSIDVISVKVYGKSKNNKVYVEQIHKRMVRNVGVEIKIQNNTNQVREVKIGHCIYDASGDHTLFQKTVFKTIEPHTVLKQDMYVEAESFRKMNLGRYKTIIWVNDKKVATLYFELDGR